MTVVSVVGTGLMGSALVRRLSSRGVRVKAWNRTVEKLRGLPADPVPDLSGVTGDLIAVLVADDDAVRSVLERGLLKARISGSVVSLMGTYTPGLVEEAARVLERAGASVLCSPILGNPASLERGEAFVIVGGDRSAYDRVAGLYDLIGRSMWIGGLREAAVAKLAYNALLLSFVQLLGESAGLVKGYGLKLEDYVRILSHTMFSELARKYIGKILSDRPASFPIKLASKDLSYALSAAEKVNVPMSVVSAAKNLFDLMIRLGRGLEDYSRAGAIESRLVE